MRIQPIFCTPIQRTNFKSSNKAEEQIKRQEDELHKEEDEIKKQMDFLNREQHKLDNEEYKLEREKNEIERMERQFISLLQEEGKMTKYVNFCKDKFASYNSVGIIVLDNWHNIYQKNMPLKQQFLNCSCVQIYKTKRLQNFNGIKSKTKQNGN